MNPRHMMVVVLLCGCATEDRDPVADDGIAVDEAASIDEDGGDNESSSTGLEPEAVPWGPCETDDDCPSFPIPYDNGTSTQNCQFGTCVYHCPSDTNPNFCPNDAAGTMYEEVPYKSVCQGGYCPMPMVVNTNCVGGCLADPDRDHDACESDCKESHPAECPEGATLYQGGWGEACFWDAPV